VGDGDLGGGVAEAALLSSFGSTALRLASARLRNSLRPAHGANAASHSPRRPPSADRISSVSAVPEPSLIRDGSLSLLPHALGQSHSAIEGVRVNTKATACGWPSCFRLPYQFLLDCPPAFFLAKASACTDSSSAVCSRPVNTASRKSTWPSRKRFLTPLPLP
jgi:hypothetical protein